MKNRNLSYNGKLNICFVTNNAFIFFAFFYKITTMLSCLKLKNVLFSNANFWISNRLHFKKLYLLLFIIQQYSFFIRCYTMLYLFQFLGSNQVEKLYRCNFFFLLSLYIYKRKCLSSSSVNFTGKKVKIDIICQIILLIGSFWCI